MLVITVRSSGVPTKEATGLPFAALIKQPLICTNVNVKIPLMLMLDCSESAVSVSRIATAALEPLLKPITKKDMIIVCVGVKEPMIFSKIAKTTNNNMMGVF
jgi:hypothetical protein